MPGTSERRPTRMVLGWLDPAYAGRKRFAAAMMVGYVTVVSRGITVRTTPASYVEHQRKSLVANFIKCTEDRGIGKQFVFVNIDQIATARFDPETGILELRIEGLSEGINFHGDEAKTAIKKIEGMMSS